MGDDFSDLIISDDISGAPLDDMANETETERKGDLKRRKALSRLMSYKRSQYAKIHRFDDIGFPAKNGRIVAITTGSFNTYTAITSLVEKGVIIDELTLTTYNMHQSVISDVFSLLSSGKVGKLSIMVSQAIKFLAPKRYEQLVEEIEACKGTNARVKLGWNHSKIALIKTKKDFYCITGSGNLSDNAQFEQYSITNIKEEYDFFKEWVDSEMKSENYKQEKIL